MKNHGMNDESKVDEVYAKMDADGSGSVSESEFRQGAPPPPHGGQQGQQCQQCGAMNGMQNCFQQSFGF
ncbi:MAG: hypothetical protein RDV48_25235 [Candidatus Eremiobacteraeota bacterium]|nr:hypothetical protein [Candidatus Eremiobacteraeota bacterium]